MTATPIKLPAVTPAQWQLHKTICSRRNEFSFQLGDGLCHLKLQPSKAAPAPEYCLTFAIDNQLVPFHVSSGFINQLLPTPLNDKAARKLPENLFRSAMIYSMEPLVSTISSRLNMPVEYVSLKQERPEIIQTGLTLHLNWNKTIHSILVNASPVIMTLLSRLPTHIHSTMPDIPVWAELIVGRSILSLPEVGGLSIGDVVFMQQYVTGQQLILRIARQSAFVADAEDNRVTIRQRMELMEEQTHPAETDAQSSVDMADIPVELLFEIGRQKFSIADIQAMQEGYIFELERPVDQPVLVRANGKVIAQCQLVQIDNRLGAKITSLSE